jgi:hypothetical protein
MGLVYDVPGFAKRLPPKTPTLVAMSDNLPPGVYRDPDANTAPRQGNGDGIEVKPDWKDFIALTMAVYQVLFLPLLVLIGALLGVALLVTWLAR